MRIVWLTAGLLLLASAFSFGSGSVQAADQNRHVIVVSIDGLAAYLLDDPKAPLPTIRALARAGTVATGGMKVSNPSVTWPNHTSLVTGTRPEKHGVLANGVLVRGAVGLPTVVDPKRDQQDLVRMPTIFDAVHAAGLTTGDINWPCTRASKTLHDSFPDVPEQVVHMTPRLRTALVAAGILHDETQASFAANSVVGRDLIWTEAACHVIRQRKPNLLLVHLLNVDATHHSLGPQTPAGYTANAYADMCLAKLVAATKEAGISEQTTFIVLADHGFTMTPKAICPNVVLRQEGLLTVTAGKLAEARVHVFPEGGVGLVYCTDPGTVAADREKVKSLLKEKEGVAEILFPDRYAEVGLPLPREYPQSPDAILVAKDGYAVSATVAGDSFVIANTEARTSLGSHGFVSTFNKMNAICVLSGSGIRRGGQVEKIENIDIAPTIARLLQVEFPSADGKPLSGALNE
jgi:predicted AlkP superfamily pyrophosphatase or phosphodiesterase